MGVACHHDGSDAVDAAHVMCVGLVGLIIAPCLSADPGAHATPGCPGTLTAHNPCMPAMQTTWLVLHTQAPFRHSLATAYGIGGATRFGSVHYIPVSDQFKVRRHWPPPPAHHCMLACVPCLLKRSGTAATCSRAHSRHAVPHSAAQPCGGATQCSAAMLCCAVTLPQRFQGFDHAAPRAPPLRVPRRHVARKQGLALVN